MRIVFFIAGLITMLVFGGIIVCEVENAKHAEDHPFLTMFDGVPNPNVGIYTYKAPYSAHEVVMMIGAGAGALLFLAGFIKRTNKTESK